ncbi:MAG: AraC family transcriptional regulator [Pseudomonadota bacterium]
MSGAFLEKGTIRRQLRSVEVSYARGYKPSYDVSGVPDGVLLSINLAPTQTDIALGSDKARPIFTPTGSSILTPPGIDVHERSEAGSKDYFFLHFNGSQFAKDSEGLDLLRTVEADVDPFIDPAIAAFGREMRRHLISGEVEGALYLEELTSLIFRRCALRFAHLQTGPNSPDLGRADLKIVEEYVAAHLGQQISVEDVAAVLGIPARAFSTAFRAATGQGFAAFILDRRVRGARHLLEQSDETLASIAYACGFSSQQHMTNAFSAKLGISPGRYRREVTR